MPIENYYHCGEPIPSRAVELLTKLAAEGDLSPEEMAELNTLDCPKRCFSDNPVA